MLNTTYLALPRAALLADLGRRVLRVRTPARGRAVRLRNRPRPAAVMIELVRNEGKSTSRERLSSCVQKSNIICSVLLFALLELFRDVLRSSSKIPKKNIEKKVKENEVKPREDRRERIVKDERRPSADKENRRGQTPVRNDRNDHGNQVKSKPSRSRSRSPRRKRKRRSPTPRPTKIHIGRLTRTVNK